MSSKAPWSIKGVDEKTRVEMKKIAEETGVTLAELLAELLSKKKRELKTPKTNRATTSVTPAKQSHAQLPSKDAHNQKGSQGKTMTPPEPVAKKIISKQEIKQFRPERHYQDNHNANLAAATATEIAPPTLEQENNIYQNLLHKNDLKMDIAVHNMPKNYLKEIVVEGRDLRDALRIHTKELALNIKINLEETLQLELTKISNLIRNNPAPMDANGEYAPSPILPSFDDLKSDINDIIQSQTTSLKETICSQIEKNNHNSLKYIESSLSNINNSASPSQEQMQEFTASIQKQLTNIHQICTQMPEPSGGNAGDTQQIQNEVRNFMEMIPKWIENITDSHQSNFEYVNQTLTKLAEQIRRLEEYAQSSVEMPSQEMITESFTQQSDFSDSSQIPSYSQENHQPDNFTTPQEFEENYNAEFEEEVTPLMASYNKNNLSQDENHGDNQDFNDFSADEFATVPPIKNIGFDENYDEDNT